MASLRSVLAALLSLSLASTAPAGAADMSSLSGRLLAPDGDPAVDFLVVVRDVFSDEEFGSTPTGPDGAYRVQVPAGSRYRVVAVIDPAGQRLAVRPEHEIDLPAAGTYSLPDTNYETRAAAPAAARPWFRSPAALAGVSAVGLAVLILALDETRDSGETPASPSSP